MKLLIIRRKDDTDIEAILPLNDGDDVNWQFCRWVHWEYGGLDDDGYCSDGETCLEDFVHETRDITTVPADFP